MVMVLLHVTLLSNQPHCFVSLSAAAAEQLAISPTSSRVTALRVEWSGNVLFVGHANSRLPDAPSTSACLQIGLPTALASASSLVEHQRVAVTRVEEENSRFTSSLTLEPLTAEDWDALSAAAHLVEQRLLKQIQIVTLPSSSPSASASRQKARFPIFLSESRCIWLQPVSSSSDAQGHARLFKDTQLNIVPKLRPKPSRDRPVEKPKFYKLRVQHHSHENLTYNSTSSIKNSHPCRVMVCVNKSTLQSMQMHENQLVFLRVRHSQGFCSHDSSLHISSADEEPKRNWYRLVVRICESKSVVDNHIVLPHQVQLQLQVRCFHRIIVSALHPSLAVASDLPIHQISLCPIRVNLKSAVFTDCQKAGVSAAFLKFVQQQSAQKIPLPIVNHGLVSLDVPCDDGLNINRAQTFEIVINVPFTSPLPSSPNADSTTAPLRILQPLTYYLLADPQHVSLPSHVDSTVNLPLPIISPPVLRSSFPCRWEVPSHEIEDIGGLSSVLPRALHYLDSVFDRFRPQAVGPAGVMLVGEVGTSKTLCLKAIAHRFRTGENVHVAFVSCRTLQNEKLEKMLVLLQGLLVEAQACAPSLVVIDDIDLVFPSSNETDHEFTKSARQTMLNVFDELVGAQQKESQCGPVAFLVSATSSSSSHIDLSSPNLFPFVLNMPTLSLKDRNKILLKVLKHMGVRLDDPSACESISERFESFRARDIEIVVSRAMHGYLQRRTSGCNPSESEQILLSINDFDLALRDFIPSALKALPRTTPVVKWEDIGGLESVKAALKDTLELPSCYSPLFNHVPIKLRSGVLLYGPPGCGKTVLAAAIADHCSLPLITIKGPELLNKYIGSSEASVRAVFERARSCAPCVLFFDEMEAIATKRGGESTGVTDRVVNQFLCELDGVEGGVPEDGKGRVFILAASSRPDLIDPALLRPGRIDKSLYCSWPTRSDRLQILSNALSKSSLAMLHDSISEEKENLSNDEMLDTIRLIADETEGYSGADLIAIITNAQLKLVHNEVHRVQQSPRLDLRTGVNCLDASTLLSAYQASHASISQQERQRFQRVYSRFIASKDGSNEVLRFDPEARQLFTQA